MLAFEWQPERPPPQVGWHIQNEARHIRQLDAADIPGGKKAILTICKLSFCVEAGRQRIGIKLRFVSYELRTSGNIMEK